MNTTRDTTTRQTKRSAGAVILCDTLKDEIKKNRIKAQVTSDRTQKLQYEIKALEAELVIRKIQGRDNSPRGMMAASLRKLSKKYCILAELADDPAKRATLQRRADKYLEDARRIGGAR